MVERKTIFFVEVVVFAFLVDVIFALFVEPITTTTNDTEVYPFTKDIGLLVLFGFGLMVCFYQKFTVTVIAQMLMTVAQSIVLYIFLANLWDRIITRDDTSTPTPTGTTFTVSIAQSSQWYFAGLACIISTSSTIGKLGFLQIFNHNFITLIFYTLAEHLIVDYNRTIDTGRTLSLFGFAGTVSHLLSFAMKRFEPQNVINKDISSRGFVLSMIGVGVCWVFFASFNTALAIGFQKNLAFFNTWVSLACSTITVYAMSYLIQSKLDPYNIIFSSLSGGIAIGCIADVVKNPAAAMFVGILAGVLTYLANYSNMLSKFSEDSTGIGNLSLTSAVVGSVMSSIIIAFYTFDGGVPSNFDFTFVRGFKRQGGFQILGLVIAVCLGIAAAALNVLVLMFSKQWYEEITKREINNEKEVETVYNFYNDETEMVIDVTN